MVSSTAKVTLDAYAVETTHVVCTILK